MACVHYGVAETTQDCDLLCHTASFETLLDLLNETKVAAQACHYRGNISPPLDARWHQGGWTSHFQWKSSSEVRTLDVFGHALRESSPWPQDVFGLYAGAHTVAQMKRTNREKDWPFITALGLRMLEAEDDRGWLHIFEARTLIELLARRACPPPIVARRPAIRLAIDKDRRTTGALNAEQKLWEEMDRVRIRILEQHLRPYVAALRKARGSKDLSLLDDHALRIECGTTHLPSNPLGDYGIARIIEESKSALIGDGLVPERALDWLPDVMEYFSWLDP